MRTGEEHPLRPCSGDMCSHMQNSVGSITACKMIVGMVIVTESTKLIVGAGHYYRLVGCAHLKEPSQYPRHCGCEG